MKRLIDVILLVSVLLIMMVSGAQAYPYTIKLDVNTYSYLPGGEFTVIPVTGGLESVLSNYASIVNIGGGITFETFCVETSVDFTPASWGGPTYYAAISNNAINGNITNGNNNPLTLGAAWLYDEFATGQLTDFDYTNGTGNRYLDSGELQEAIWFFMGQNPDNASIGRGPYYTDALNALGSTVFNPSNGSYGVQVLNLYDANGNPAQNQLVLTNVPEPATMLLLGLGLMGLAGARRKFKS